MASTASTSAIDPAAVIPGRAPDRWFKYQLIAPAIFLLLLIGLFPLIYSLVVSFQRITMMEHGHLLRRASQLRAAVQGHAPVAGAAAHR